MQEALNRGIDDRLFRQIVESNREAPFYRLVGITTKALGPGYAEMAVATEKKHANPLGWVHGGLISTLADAAMGNAIRSTGKKAVTADYTISFVNSAAVSQELIGRGEVVKSGSHLVFARATVFSEEKIVASAMGTFFIVGEIELDGQ